METNLKRITAVLGPTNTGKTHLAVETMFEYKSGILGFPLRLLAREIFDKCVNKIGKEKVAFITGEEKIIPKSPRYYICTVESMPHDKIVDFVAVDVRCSNLFPLLISSMLLIGPTPWVGYKSPFRCSRRNTNVHRP